MEGENKISFSGPHNSNYAFDDTVGYGHGSNRGISVIDISTRTVPAPSANGNDIILDSDGKNWMHYVVYDPDLDVKDFTRGTMAVILTARDTARFMALGFPDESGGMIGAQAVVGITE